MKEQKLIIDEVKRHLQASARKNRYRVVDAVQEMPAFGGSVFSYCSQKPDGARFPADVEDMHINCDDRDGFRNGTAAKVAQAVSEAGQIKEA